MNSLPRQAIAKEFLRLRRDEYDFLVIFSNFDFQMPDPEARVFYHPIKNDVCGTAMGAVPVTINRYEQLQDNYPGDICGIESR